MSDITAAPTYRQAQSPIIGVLWMVAAAAFFAVTFGLVRHLSESEPDGECEG
jgi:drug/metabolite transporter (DMT)-like permease